MAMAPREKDDDAEAAVMFSLRNAQTRWGESLIVVGDCPELGCWNPEEGLRLDTSEASYPQWRSNQATLRLPVDSCCRLGVASRESLTLRYKYVRDRCSFGEGFIWEDQISDREAKIPAIGGVAVEISDEAFNDSSPPQLIHCEEEAKKAAPESLSAVVTPPVAAGAGKQPLKQGRLMSSYADGFHKEYVLLGDEPLATGGFSSVWRCSSSNNPGMVRAAKQVDLESISQRGRRLLLGHQERSGEIELHDSLQHPNVVKLLEVFHDGHVVSLVMECCQGGDLLEIILRHREMHRRGLPERGAARVMTHLCKSLAYLQGKNIVHRDVKCENIFQLEDHKTSLDDATFKLGDFGLAAQLVKDQVLLEQVGSPSTSAPEVILGRPYAMPVDMWSAGAALFTALAAQRPFEGATYAQMKDTVTRNNFTLRGGGWENASEGARDIISQLLRTEAQSRLSAQEALKHAWLRKATVPP